MPSPAPVELHPGVSADALPSSAAGQLLAQPRRTLTSDVTAKDALEHLLQVVQPRISISTSKLKLKMALKYISKSKEPLSLRNSWMLIVSARVSQIINVDLFLTVRGLRMMIPPMDLKWKMAMRLMSW